MSRGAFLVSLLLALIPSCILGDVLDYQCGRSVYITQGSSKIYYISNSRNYYSNCVVRFSAPSSDVLKLTISGNSIDSSNCAVDVKDSYDSNSQTRGNLNYASYFTKTVTSGLLSSDLVLHVTGVQCDLYSLSFTASTACTSYQFQCSSGQCVWQSDQCDGYSDCTDGSDETDCSIWSVGSYVGVSVGVFVFFVIVAVLSTVFYRRRYAYVRSPIIVTPNVYATSPPPYSVAVSSQSTGVTQSRW